MSPPPPNACHLCIGLKCLTPGSTGFFTNFCTKIVSIPKATIDSPSLIIVQWAVIIQLSHIEEPCPENKLFNQLVKGYTLSYLPPPVKGPSYCLGPRRKEHFLVLLSGDLSHSLERLTQRPWREPVGRLSTLAFRCCFQELGEFLEVLFSFESVFTGLCSYADWL